MAPGRRGYVSELIFSITGPCSVISAPRNIDQHFAHVRRVTHTHTCLEEYGGAMTVFWGRFIDEPRAFQTIFDSSSCSPASLR